jgi:hypothetical protein
MPLDRHHIIGTYLTGKLCPLRLGASLLNLSTGICLFISMKRGKSTGRVLPTEADHQ